MTATNERLAMPGTIPPDCPTPDLHGIPVPTMDVCANCNARPTPNYAQFPVDEVAASVRARRQNDPTFDEACRLADADLAGAVSLGRPDRSGRAPGAGGSDSSDEPSIAPASQSSYASELWRAEAEAEQHRLVGEIDRLRAALTRLVDLKDGVRDESYWASKPSAWAGARVALGRRSSVEEMVSEEWLGTHFASAMAEVEYLRAEHVVLNRRLNALTSAAAEFVAMTPDEWISGGGFVETLYAKRALVRVLDEQK